MSALPFKRAYETIPSNGWLSEAEAKLLYEEAGRYKGPILEVGCYQGRSTCLLGYLGRIVYAVDPIDGFGDTDPIATLGALKGGLEERGLRNVKFFQQKIGNWILRPVGFAYLDGDHTPEGTREQIDVAKRCHAQGIAIHDVNDSGDGLAIKQVALEMLGPWHERVERLAVWRL